MKKKRPLAVLMSAFLVLGSVSFGFADDPGKEGTVVGIDKDAMLFVVRGSDGDQWTVSWATGTKPRGDMEGPQLRMYERVRFDYTERGGVNWLTDLEHDESR
jgi:hypothetical protein